MKLPFRIKICGLRSESDVSAAVKSGADAIGFNFCRSSSRYVDPDIAATLSQYSKGKCLRVGVFVNPSPQEIESILLRCELDVVQLHGEETPELVFGSNIPVLRALSYQSDQDNRRIQEWIDSADECRLIGFLIDAFDPIARGGTGKKARWDLLSPRPKVLSNWPMVLAGGLNPSNVTEAIQIAKPDAVDIASGVESSPGVKSPELMLRFVQAANSSFVLRGM